MISSYSLVHEEGIVLITGCSSGIGLDAAIELAKARPKYTVYAAVRKQADVDALNELKVLYAHQLLTGSPAAD